VDEDYDAALRGLRPFLDAQPNHADATFLLAGVQRRRGQLEESLDLLRRAVELDPQNPLFLSTLGGTLQATRSWAEAARWNRQSLDLEENAWVRGQTALDLFFASCRQRCDPAESRRLLRAAAPDEDGVLAMHLFLLDLYAAAPDFETAAVEGALAALEPLGERGGDSVYLNHLIGPRFVALERVGRAAAAAAWLESRAEAIEAERIANPDYPTDLSHLALVRALQGRAPEALRLAEQGAARSEADRFSGPRERELRALVLALTGHREESEQLVGELLASSYQRALSEILLEKDPLWLRARAGSPG
ncbi:MAG: tetratricopeptide repeat protein, partial [Acidobacteriota bacterium]